MKLLNILHQACDGERREVLIRKLARRIWQQRGTLAPHENHAWLAEHAIEVGQYASGIDAALWQRAVTRVAELRTHANNVLMEIPFRLGGGAASELLYFLTLLLRPSVILETGVAAGHSSLAFLDALRENREGRLYSSDFPYFRLPHPERYVGIVVPAALRDRWVLRCDGDSTNIPRLLGLVETVDLLHYDSDKSYAGRQEVWERVRPQLSHDGIVVFDDIQDNSHFHDLVNGMNHASWKVFEYEGKYVGLLGDVTSRLEKSCQIFHASQHSL
jgi:predicted O-methyltransferase YrrM